jgi:3-deoxy-D-manno-octulosonic acid (KDO) 8-phosphate synthase
MLQFHPASFDKKNGTLAKRYKGKTLEADMKIHEQLNEKKGIIKLTLNCNKPFVNRIKNYVEKV